MGSHFEQTWCKQSSHGNVGVETSAPGPAAAVPSGSDKDHVDYVTDTYDVQKQLSVEGSCIELEVVAILCSCIVL